MCATMSKIDETRSQSGIDILETLPENQKSRLLDEFDILGFDFPDSIQFGASTPLKGRTVSAADQLEVEDVGRRALNSFRNFAATPDGPGALATALDGLMPGQRDLAQQTQVDLVVDQLLQDRSLESDLAAERFQPPGFRAVKTGDRSEIMNGPTETVLPETLDAAMVMDDAGRSQILLSADLGFRDAQLAAQDMIAQSFAQYAEASGVPVAPGNVAARLASAVRNQVDEPEKPGDASDPAMVRFEGKVIEARSQMPASDL